MRRLTKTAIPQVLVDHGDAWRDELLAAIDAGGQVPKPIKDRYRHHAIKSSLLCETLNKCAYCESKLLHVTYGDIEHIIPKSKVPAKSFDWENLTIACDVCNTMKGDTYTDDPNLSHENIVDPYVDDPTAHLIFMREIVIPRPDSWKGYHTDQLIELSRGQLVERRRERLDFIDGLVRAYSLAEEAQKPLLLRDLYTRHLKDEDEYVGVAREYVQYLRDRGILAGPALPA